MNDVARWVLDHPEAAIATVGGLATLFKKSRNWLITLLAAPIRLVRWLTSFATLSKTPAGPDRLPLDMPIWLKVRLDRLLACNSADDVANLFRQEGVRGRKDISHMSPTAIFIAGRDGRCSVYVSTDGISIWGHGGIGAWKMRAPHVIAFEEAFHRGEHEEVHMFGHR